MKERGLLFSAPMVRAALAGRKTVTRRLDMRWLKAQPGDVLWGRETHAQFAVGEGRSKPVPQCVAYRATCDADGGFDYVKGDEVMRLKVTKWTPSIFMPRWASRIVTPVVSVRAEQLHDITEADALAEGLTTITKDGSTVKYGVPDRDGLPGTDDDGWAWQDWERDPRKAYAKLWDAINGARAPWSSNPTVVVITFQPLGGRDAVAKR